MNNAKVFLRHATYPSKISCIPDHTDWALFIQCENAIDCISVSDSAAQRMIENLKLVKGTPFNSDITGSTSIEYHLPKISNQE